MSSRPDRSSTALAALLSLALHGVVLAACLTSRQAGAPGTAPAPAHIAVVLVSAVLGDAPAAMPEAVLVSAAAAEQAPEQGTSAPRAPVMRLASRDDDVTVQHSSTTAPVPRPRAKPRAVATIAATTAPIANPSVDAPISADTPSGRSAAEKSETVEAASVPAVSSARNYLAEIMASLARHQRYPEAARIREQQGTVLIAFAVDRSGHVLSCAIRTGSGNAALDRAAEDMIRDADPLPAPPPSYPGTRFEMVLPVTFNLRS